MGMLNCAYSISLVGTRPDQPNVSRR